MKSVLLICILLLCACISRGEPGRAAAGEGPQATPRGIPAEPVQTLLNNTADAPAAEQVEYVAAFLAEYGNDIPFIENNTVTFMYFGKPSEPVAVVGAFNSWNRMVDPMEQIGGSGLYYLALEIEGAAEDGVHYMYALNHVQRRNFVLDPHNPRVSFAVVSPGSYAVAEKEDTGMIVVAHEQFPSQQPNVRPKQILAWLPPSYHTQPERRYPVLYMHDGQNIWTGDGMPWGGWQVDTIAETMIAQGLIEEVIIVALPHGGADRMAEYSLPYRITHERVGDRKVQGWGDQYLQYLISVKEYIDAHYRTRPDAASTGVAGSSMGGLISWYIVRERPDVFGIAGCFSPWFICPYEKDDGTPLSLEEMIGEGPKTGVRIYMDCGDTGYEDDGVRATVPAYEMLVERGWTPGEDILFVLEEGAIHNEQAWTRRFPGFLKFAFGKNE